MTQKKDVKKGGLKKKEVDTALQNWCFIGTETTGSSLGQFWFKPSDYTGYPRCGALYRGAALSLLGERGGAAGAFAAEAALSFLRA